MNDMSFSVRVAANGRMVLPAELRRALGVTGETKVEIKLENGEVRLRTLAEKVRWAQEQYRKYAKNPGTVDDFLRERREDAERRDSVLNQFGPR